MTQTMDDYRSTMVRLGESLQRVSELEDRRRLLAEKLFGELFGVERGDVFRYMKVTDILVVGFDWKSSLAELDYDEPRPPTLIVSARKIDGTWGKTLTKKTMVLELFQKVGSDEKEAERLRMRA